jgi:ferrous iron transport protein B
MGLHQIFSPLSACSFLIFVLLYTPCSAALAAIRRESGSMKVCLLSAFWQFATAYYVSALFFQCAHLLSRLPP